MRPVLYATAGLFALASPVFAQSGGGGVPNQAPPAAIGAGTASQDTGSARVPTFDGPPIPFDNRVVPSQANEGPVQSTNSLPRGGATEATPEAQRDLGANNEPVVTGKLTPNNGSGITQSAGSGPQGYMEGTVPQQSSSETSKYVADQMARQLAAQRERDAAAAAAAKQ